MKNYTEKLVNTLKATRDGDGGYITPVRYIKDVLNESTVTLGSAQQCIGYLGRITSEGLLKRDKDDSRDRNIFILTPKGHWVIEMYEKGWIYKDSQWINENTGGQMTKAVGDLLASTGKVP